MSGVSFLLRWVEVGENILLVETSFYFRNIAPPIMSIWMGM